MGNCNLSNKKTYGKPFHTRRARTVRVIRGEFFLNFLSRSSGDYVRKFRVKLISVVFFVRETRNRLITIFSNFSKRFPYPVHTSTFGFRVATSSFRINKFYKRILFQTLLCMHDTPIEDLRRRNRPSTTRTFPNKSFMSLKFKGTG